MIRVLLDAEQIAQRRREMAERISRDYAGEEPVMVCVLKGSMPFFVDLARDILLPVRFEFVAVRSYGDARRSSGKVELAADLEGPIAGRHILLVEDIVDTGRTISWLRSYLAKRDPASIRVAALLDKPSRRVVPVEVEYTGFVIEDHFVVGYGLDHAQRFRNLPFIGVLTGEDEPPNPVAPGEA